MAWRFPGSDSAYVRRTSSLPSHNNMTACGWAMLPTDTNKVNVLCIIDNLVDSYWICETASDGTTLQIASDNVLENDIGTITPGVPFFWAVTASGTDSGETIGYMRSLGSNTLLSQPLVGNRNFGWSAGEFRIGSTPVGGGEYWTGDIGPVMVFDRVLTAHELEVQSYYARPMFATSLHLWWPATDPSSAQDLSGNGRNGTIAGALTAGDLGNQLWSPRKRIFLPAKADGASVSLEGAAVAAVTAAGALSKAVALAGDADAGASASGVLAHAVPLAGAALTSSIANGELTIAVNLAGNAFVNALAAAQMAHGVPLAGSASAGADASADLSTSADAALAGSAIASASAAAALQLSISLSGDAIARVVASAELAHDVPLAGDAAAQASATGSLSLLTRLTGSATATASATGDLEHHVPLEGSATAGAEGSAALLGTTALEGSATAGAQAAGTLSLTVALTAQAVANALATGALQVSVRLRGDAIARALAGGELTVFSDVKLQGDAVASAQADGALSVGISEPITSIEFARVRSRAMTASRLGSRSISFG